MTRAVSNVNRKKRHKKVLEQTKGYRGRAGNCYTIAFKRLEHGLAYAYRDRKAKKRTFRALWIQRINAASRQHGLVYSQFIAGLKHAGIELDRKVLADIAVKDAAAFALLAKQAQDGLKKAA